MVFCHLFITDQFSQVFRDFNTKLPGITDLYIRFSGVVAWTMLGLTIVAVIVPLAAMFLPLGAWLGRATSWIPVLGTIVRDDRHAQFSHLMALLLEEEVPLPEALRLTSIALQGTVLARPCHAAAAAVEEGMPLDQGIGHGPLPRQPDGPGRLGTAEDLPGRGLPRRGRGLRGPHQFANCPAEHARAAADLHAHRHIRRHHDPGLGNAINVLDFSFVGCGPEARRGDWWPNDRLECWSF